MGHACSFWWWDSLVQENKDLLPLYAAHGITAVRDAVQGKPIAKKLNFISISMKRRVFIKISSLAGVTLSTLATSCKQETATKVDAAEAQPFALEETTIHELQQKMKSGDYTSRFITEMYLKQIEKIDKNGPKIN
ncbi:MAG: hypothetical protein C0490_16345 [Marivirga sp.]|nr:hypothetical protein [Marivirga sp.]